MVTETTDRVAKRYREEFMDQKEFEDVIAMLQSEQSTVHAVSLPEETIARMTREQAEEIASLYSATTLIALPERERTFFAWLRANDPEVWQDLWGSDEEQEYLVSIGFLPELLPKRRGFLICDLEEHQNFYFTEESITPEEGKIFLDAALDIVHANGQLEMEQAFVIEAWRAPIDMWRFAYNYNLPLAEVRKMVLWLLSEEILLLPPTEEDSGGDGSGGNDISPNGVGEE